VEVGVANPEAGVTQAICCGEEKVMNKRVIAPFLALMMVTMACGLPSLISKAQPTVTQMPAQPTATQPPPQPTVTQTPAQPTATQTPPQPTATQTPPLPSTILYQADLSDPNSGWTVKSISVGSAGYGNGGYFIKIITPKQEIYSNTSKVSQEDVRIEVDASKLAGPERNDTGVDCRNEDNNNFYYGVIGNDGNVKIAAWINGHEKTIVKKPTTGVVNSGSATNHIRFDCIGNTLTLYVNGQQVLAATDSSLSGGDLGLFARTYETSGLDILFKNLVVYKP
jgi:hypothetical protein